LQGDADDEEVESESKSEEADVLKETLLKQKEVIEKQRRQLDQLLEDRENQQTAPKVTPETRAKVESGRGMFLIVHYLCFLSKIEACFSTFLFKQHSHVLTTDDINIGMSRRDNGQHTKTYHAKTKKAHHHHHTPKLGSKFTKKLNQMKIKKSARVCDIEASVFLPIFLLFLFRKKNTRPQETENDLEVTHLLQIHNHVRLKKEANVLQNFHFKFSLVSA
jgi:hypothetical protein